MTYRGELRKMPVSFEEETTVQYQMSFFDSARQKRNKVLINNWIGKDITIQFTHHIFCKKCGKITKTSFNQGFCYSCFRNAPESAECIIRPELCRAHLGEGRDPQWEKKHHNQPHIVYLAATNVIKVGVTRNTQIPTRWIDQGASSAIILAKTPNRYTAGIIEVALKESFTDRTNWRKMLTNEIDESIDLEETKWELEELLPDDIAQYITEEDETLSINYPVIAFPEKVKSLSLEKQPLVSGKLMGIKGQYFLLDKNQVLNIRKHIGFEVEVKITD